MFAELELSIKRNKAHGVLRFNSLRRRSHKTQLKNTSYKYEFLFLYSFQIVSFK